MPRPHPAQPDPNPDSFWPSCDDQQPGVSIRPLNHADLAALLAHLDHDQHDPAVVGPASSPPVVAVRVRASVGHPGASAQAEYRRRRAAERAAWRVTVHFFVIAWASCRTSILSKGFFRITSRSEFPSFATISCHE